MGRKAGSTMRCTCRTCGAIEVKRGCNNSFQCTSCRPRLFTLKEAAHSAVAVAVRRGDLPRASDCQCADCGGPAIEYEHRDYTKPLDVVPICRRCNLRRGPAIGSLAMKRTTVYVKSGAGITHGEFLARDLPDLSLVMHATITPEPTPFGIPQPGYHESAAREGTKVLA